MGSTGAVPGSEAGGDRGVRDGLVSEWIVKLDESVMLVALLVYVERGNKESDGDRWCHTGSRTVPQPNKRKVSALRRTHAASLPYMMETLAPTPPLHRSHPVTFKAVSKSYGERSVGGAGVKWPKFTGTQQWKAAFQAPLCVAPHASPFVINDLLCGRLLNCSKGLNAA